MVAVFILGVITGALSNLTSGGAGVFTIFVLSRFGNLSIQSAVGTVLAASTVFVFVGALTFYRKKQVDGQLSVTVGLAGVAGAFLAARIASSIQSTTVERLFGAFTLIVAGYTLFRLVRSRTTTRLSIKKDLVSSGTEDSVEMTRWSGRDPAAIAMQLGVGTLLGFATGLFGVGGGGLTMAILLFVFKLRAKMMLGTSLMASFYRYAGGALGYLTAGLISPLIFVILAIAGSIGSLLGARTLVTRTKDVYVQVIVILLLLFVSVEFLAK